MKKAMFIDLDGTLLSEKHQISKLDKEAIAKATEAGWDIILSTGKSIANSRKFYDELNLNTWLITSQGQMIEKPHEKKAIKNYMSFKHVKEVLEQTDTVSFVIETTKGVYTNKPDDIAITKFLDCKPFEYIDQKLDGIIGLYIVADKSNYYQHKHLDIFKWDTAQGYKVLSFKPKGINKTFALETLRDKEKYETIIVFGNGRNDLKSLQMADLGIAMINSQKKVLAETKIKSEKDNNHSGVGIEINKILNGYYKL